MTMGPLKKFLKALTRRLSFSRRCGSSGTPWSGQLMNWMWVTSLSEFLSLFCTHTHTDGYTNMHKHMNICVNSSLWMFIVIKMDRYTGHTQVIANMSSNNIQFNYFRTHISEAEMSDGVIRTVVLWVQLHNKLLKDLRLPLWWRPVLRTLDLQQQHFRLNT